MAGVVPNIQTFPASWTRAYAASPGTFGKELTEEQKAQIVKLQQREREVIAHERAHKTVGGPYAGAIHYDYQRGPDGRNYIVGGEVQLEVSKEKTPEATIRKMKQVKAAALAPARPSPQDYAVAAKASQMISEAQMEKARQTAPYQGGNPYAHPGMDIQEVLGKSLSIVV